MVMNDPVYFLLGRIDITGGSTGYYRAALIQATIQHFNEWWLTGTDYTRDWLPGGAGVASANHTDMTNYFIYMGIMGGLILMLVFMGVLYAAFCLVGKILKLDQMSDAGDPYLAWILGSILFGHVATFFSVSYFDVNTAACLSLTLGAIGAMYAKAIVNNSLETPEEC